LPPLPIGCGLSSRTRTARPDGFCGSPVSPDAVRSAKLFGGVAEDYLAVHNWFDESKAFMPDLRHRALRHHAEGIFLCERLLGVTLRNSAGREVPVRLVGEQHVKDDLGWIPTVKDWLVNLKVEPWMTRTPFRPGRDGTAVPPADAAAEVTDGQ
jgi:hypothetical protein